MTYGRSATYSGVACLWGRSDLPGLTPRTRDTLMPRWKFGYVRQLPSGRWQPGHHGPDGHRHTGSATLANAIDAERWLVTTQRLPTWEGAFDNLGEPAHVSRPGVLVDIKGLLSGTVDSDRPVRCLCIYLTKDVADTYSDEYPTHAAGYERHVDRLHGEIQTLPCSPRGRNGNRYRVTSNDPERGMVPGRCSSPAPPGEPRPRRAPGPSLAAVVRQDAGRAQGRPSRGRRGGPPRCWDRPWRRRSARCRPDHARRHTQLCLGRRRL